MGEVRSIKDDFMKDGYVVLPRAIEPAFLRKMEEAIAKLDNQSMELGDRHFVSPGVVSSMHNLSKYLPWYEEYFNDSILKGIAADLLSADVSSTPCNSSYFAKPARIGIATKAHQDQAFFHFSPPLALTCWFGLDHSDEENGAVYYYAGSQALGFLPHSPNGNKGASQTVSDLSPLVRFTRRILQLGPGDAVLHSSLIVHGSEPNRSNERRRGFNYSYVAKECKRDEKNYSAYKEQLRIFLEQKEQKNGEKENSSI